jgi:hypothetical protein
MSVVGLSPATADSIAVSSADGGLNVARSGPLERSTLPDATAGAPVLNGRSATDPSGTSTLVTWQTDVAATTFVRFGEDPDVLDRSAGDLTAATTAHRVVLTGLAARSPFWVLAPSSNPCQQSSIAIAPDRRRRLRGRDRAVRATCRRSDGAGTAIPAEGCPVSRVSGRSQVTSVRLEVPHRRHGARRCLRPFGQRRHRDPRLRAAGVRGPLA